MSLLQGAEGKRPDGVTCRGCIWFAAKVPLKVTESGWVVGRCHRYAPNMYGFPPVIETDWCGDYTVDEERVEDGDKTGD